MMFRLFWFSVFFCVILSSAQTDPIEFLKKKGMDNPDFNSGNYLTMPKYVSGKKFMLDYSNSNNSSANYSLPAIGFDEKIDEEKYTIGTGDGFTIYIWGTINSQLTSVVNIEGDLFLKDIGIVDIKGKSLKESKEIIKKKISEYYKSVDITIVLSKIREFKVYVLGEVLQPGAYIIDGTTRITDLIQLSGGLTDSSSLRKVVILNSIDSTINTADLALFYKCNDITKNPYLKEGDRVFVEKRKEIISIAGAVNYPGEYDFVSDDSLSSIIRLCGGLARGADSNRIIIKRFINNVDSLSTVICSYGDSVFNTFKLCKDDRIFVSFVSDYRKFRNVTIKGEVTYPGVYPIQKDKTSLSEIIEMAGGLTKDANLKNSIIKRKSDIKISTRELERLNKLPPELLSPMEKSFVLARITDDESNISLDIKNDNTRSIKDFSNIILRDGDEIIIESKSLSVKIIGGVIAPGLVEYNEGAKLNYYIARAGGFNDNAKESYVKIMKYGTEAWNNCSSTTKIEAGDVIWVPEKTYHNRLTFAKDMLMLLGSVATIIVSLLSINELVKQ